MGEGYWERTAHLWFQSKYSSKDMFQKKILTLVQHQGNPGLSVTIALTFR